MLVGADDGLCLIDADRRYVYADPTACQTLRLPLERLRGRDFLASFPPREHATMLAHLPQHVGGAAARFACAVLGPGGAEQEVDCSTFGIGITGRPHWVVIFRDRTGHQMAARTAMALAHTAAQLAGTGTTDEILRAIARHGAEDTRALACGIVVVGVLGGLRWAECAGLTVGNLDLLAGTVTVSQQLGRDLKLGPPKSVAGRRRLALPEWLVDDLAAHLARRGLTAADRDALVFCAPKGEPLRYQNWLRRTWRPACEAAGFPPYGSTTSARWRPPPSWLPASPSGPPRPGWGTRRRPLHSPSMHVRQPRQTVEQPTPWGVRLGAFAHVARTL
jgi:hypothetical protein